MNFKRVIPAALPAVAFSLMSSASLANTSQTVFSKTVDQNCNFTATDTAAALTLSTSGKVLSGTTDTLTIKCNYGVEVGLALTANTNNPEETTNTSSITIAGSESAASANSNGRFELGNSNGVEKSFTLGMSATSANAQLLPGAYEYTVVMTLVAS